MRNVILLLVAHHHARHVVLHEVLVHGEVAHLGREVVCVALVQGGVREAGAHDGGSGVGLLLPCPSVIRTPPVAAHVTNELLLEYTVPVIDIVGADDVHGTAVLRVPIVGCGVATAELLLTRLRLLRLHLRHRSRF